MNRRSKILLSVPRTIWFNFRYLPFSQAVKLPIWIANNVRIKRLYRGGLQLTNASLGIIRIGYHEADAVDCFGTHTILDIYAGGKIVFAQDAHIGQGAILCVKSNGKLSLGKNFAVSGTTSFVCSNEISIGDDVQFSWNSLVMDSDAHHIYDESGKEIPNTGCIQIGNKVWIAANTTILKGATIGNNCIVASNSLLSKSYSDKTIIGGIPGKEIKKISNWKL